MKENYKVNPEFVEKESGKKIIEGIIEDLGQLRIQIDGYAKQGKIEK
jgi:hypothetical protein